MAGGVQGGEAHMSASTFHSQLGAAAARRASFEPSAAAYHNSAEFARHVRAAAGRGEVPVTVFNRERAPGVVYANISASWRHLGPVDVLLLGLLLPDRVVPVHGNFGYSALQPRPGAERGVVLAAQLPGGGGGGAVYSRDYVLQPRPSAGHGEVLVDLLIIPDGAGHGVVFVGLLQAGVDAAYDNYCYYALQPRAGAGHGDVLVDLLDGAGNGEVFVDLLPGGGGAMLDDYGYYPWQPRPGAGRGEVFIMPLHDGVDAWFVDSGNFAQERAVRRAGVEIGAGYDGSGALAGAAYNNLPMVGGYLHRLLAFVGIGACSVAVNGLAAGPGSPPVAFHFFALLLGGLFLVILHVLRV